MLRDTSIKNKLSVLAGLAVASALILCCAAFLFNDFRSLKLAKKRQIDSIAAVLGGNLISSLDFNDQRSAMDTLASLANQPHVDLAVLYDHQGKVFATYPAEARELFDIPVPDGLSYRCTQGAGFLQVEHPINHWGTSSVPTTENVFDLLKSGTENAPQGSANNHANNNQNDNSIIGQILVRANTSDIYAQIGGRSQAAAVVLIISLGVGLVIARFFQRLITSPVNQLVSAAKHIARSQDFSHRAVKQGNDELGVLCDAFNSMLAELQLGRVQLQQAHDELEQRVVERTAELKTAMEKAQAANQAKSDFLANMSHEIRTPMTSILGYAELLEEQDSDAVKRHEHLAAIQRNGKHLLTLINDILDVSKIEAGQMTTERIECRICEVLADLLSLLRQRARDKGIQLEIEYRGEIPLRLYTDPTRLRQILVNLVGNAIKFTERGSVTLVVSMAAPSKHLKPRLQFEVIDTGIGLDSDKKENIFKAFTQADGTMSRRFGGTGLGLTISKGLAKMLGGDIQVESELGKGSTFTVTVETGPLDGVPMVADCREAFQELENERQAQLRARPPATDLDGRILLVEDGLDNQRLLTFLLTKAGADVMVAENGKVGCEKALEAWRAGESYDLVFMDMQMPVMDGYQATRELRDAGYSLPIVALTAHAMSHERAKCLEAGCDDYFTKPVDRTRLIAVAAEWISGGEKCNSPEPIPQAR